MWQNKRLYLILLLIAFLGGCYTIYDYYKYNERREKDTINIARAKSTEVKDYLDSLANYLESYTKAIAKDLSENKYSSEKLAELIELKTKAARIGIGLTIAYEPFAFEPDTELFAIYYDKAQSQLYDITEIYNYTDSTLEASRWYTQVRSANKPTWSDPYFADDFQELVVDFGAPIYKTSNSGQNELIGLVTITLALDQFGKLINRISLGNSGYGILTTIENQILAHPKTEYINNAQVANGLLTQFPEFKRLAIEKEGLVEFYSAYSFQESLAYFNRLENNWVLTVVFSATDLLGPDEDQDNKLIHLSAMVSLFLLLGFILLSKAYEGETKRLWVLAISLAIITLVNIGYIWYINIVVNDTMDSSYNKKITTETELSNSIYRINESARKVGYPPAIEIPTGIYISDIEFKNDYDVALSGKIWQKINDSLEIRHDLNFVFPQKSPIGLSVRTEQVAKTHIDGYWLLRYNFNATLQFDFEYDRYPLDLRVLNIQLMYPDIHENRMLVPDLEGYKILNSSSSPGYDKTNYLPEASVESAYFSFDQQDFNSNLGNEEYAGPSDAPVLTYNIIVKRNILNPVITNILPIFVIAVLMFLLTFTIHKQNGELIEGNALSVIQAFGGFFFVLLLAHIQLRRGLLAPEISYLETFYFLMYSLIALVSSGMLLYVKTDRFDFLEYKNNLLLKMAFWPFLLLSIYFITLLKFY